MEEAVLFLGIFCVIFQIQHYLQAIGDKEDFSVWLSHICHNAKTLGKVTDMLHCR
jgi:hypothetical protein